MNYETIATFTGLITALIAIIALIIESKRYRFSTSLQTILKLVDEFERERMYLNRKRAALAFKKKKYDSAVNEIDEIIDFFEGMGFLTRKKALNKEAVWVFFFSYIGRFYHFVKDYVNQESRGDPTLWKDFIWLHNELCKIEKKHRHKLRLRFKLSKHDLEKFLEEEMHLEVKSLN